MLPQAHGRVQNYRKTGCRRRPEGQRVISKANARWNFPTCWKAQQRGVADRRHVLEDGLIFHSAPITQRESKDGSPPSRGRCQPDRTALHSLSLRVAAPSQDVPFPCPLCTLYTISFHGDKNCPRTLTALLGSSSWQHFFTEFPTFSLTKVHVCKNEFGSDSRGLSGQPLPWWRHSPLIHG